MISVGLIGYGKMGQIRANTLRKNNKVYIHSAYDISCLHISKDNLKGTSSPDEIIDNKEIDAVFICTPNYLNQPLTLKALNAGKHVFCEKPPAFNSEGVEEIKKIEKRSKKKLMYGFNHRHHESVKRIKEIVDSNNLGKILWMRGRYGKEVNDDFFKGWRANPKLSGGGILIDQGIHMLDLMLHLGEDFDEVQSMVSNLYWQQKGVEDNVFVNLRNNNTGICASVHSTMTQWRYLFSLEVFLEGGSLILNGLKTSSGAYGDEKLSIKRNQSHLTNIQDMNEEHIVFHSDNSWISEIQHFVSSIEENQSISIGSSEDALKVMRIIDKIYER
jgi:predicted dehydrogenase